MNRIQEIIDRKYKDNSKPNYVNIASEIGVSTVMLNHWRKNRQQPNMIWLPRIASVLGVEIQDLIKQEPRKLTAEEKEKKRIDRLRKQGVKEYFYGQNVIYARNQKNADRKARNKGYL